MEFDEHIEKCSCGNWPSPAHDYQRGEHYYDNPPTHHWKVDCRKCKRTTNSFRDRDQAISAWNNGLTQQ